MPENQAVGLEIISITLYYLIVHSFVLKLAVPFYFFNIVKNSLKLPVNMYARMFCTILAWVRVDLVTNTQFFEVNQVKWN